VVYGKGDTFLRNAVNQLKVGTSIDIIFHMYVRRNQIDIKSFISLENPFLLQHQITFTLKRFILSQFGIKIVVHKFAL
jgi:hypothetical protein